MDVHPNLIAYLALAVWPLVALYFYSRLPIAQATLWTILGGYLLLPAGLDIKFQMIPVFNKDTIPNLAALLGCALYARRLPKFFRGFGIAEALVLVILIGPFVTSLLNSDPIRVGPTVLPGVGAYDAGSAAIYQFIYVLPFLLGRQYLPSDEDNAQILRILAVAGLAYSLPMLFEIRMSPQLSNWIYGYTPQSIIMEMREGGFRPVVFLTNGLLTSFFAMTATLAATALWRTRTRIGRWSPGGITGYLSVLLILCKSLGAFMYGAVLIPLIRWASPRMQLRVACVLAAIAFSYPLLRVADLVPTTSILRLADSVSTARADSLDTRFVWEERLLSHAWQRRWFGWGRYGRSRILDAETGEDRSTTDGYWIITMGTFGLMGFMAQFGLLALPIFRAAKALKFAQSMREAVYLAALALIIGINMIDLLPNASLSPWTWLLVGALLGRSESLLAVARQRLPRANLRPPPVAVHG